MNRQEFDKLKKPGKGQEQKEYVRAEADWEHVTVHEPAKKHDYLHSDGKERTFCFDRSFSGHGVAQEDVYNASAKPLIKNLVDAKAQQCFAMDKQALARHTP